MHTELWALARKLSDGSFGPPTQAELKRGVSTAYYAVFHAFAACAADLLVGNRNDKNVSTWSRVYRAIDHLPAATACRTTTASTFPTELADCAAIFVDLQTARHKADYDPLFDLTETEAMLFVLRARFALLFLGRAEPDDLRRFVIHLLIKKRA